MTNADTQFDFLIIGQGLAGSLLAWRLITQGQKVLLVDSCRQQTASRTAAGLINPVTGKRLVKPARVENYLSTAKKLYQDLSVFFNEKFLFEKPQLKLFRSEDDILQWQKRKKDPAYDDFLGEQFTAVDKSFLTTSSLGGFNQEQCAYLDTVPLLDKLRLFFIQENSFVNAQFKLNELNINSDHIKWREYKAAKLIFCDGHQLQNNPWFSPLPLQPVQGEILTMETEQALPEEIIQFGKWLLPLSNKRFKLGSTWQWQPLDETPTQAAFSQLTEACYAEFPQLKSARLIETNVGVRPATKDKNPFIGPHPQQLQLMVFNGFGAKGSLLIPWYSECFSRYLLTGEALPKHVDITRYDSLLTLS